MVLKRVVDHEDHFACVPQEGFGYEEENDSGDFVGLPSSPRQKRQAADAVMQMSELKVFRKAVIALDMAFRREGLPAAMELLLHGGTMFTCPDDETVISQYNEVIRLKMQGSAELSVTLVAESDLTDHICQPYRA